jgi:hypothetical protein
MREKLLTALEAHAKGHIEKHRINIEVYLTNSVGIGEHSDIIETIEKELDEIARYQDQLDILKKYFG